MLHNAISSRRFGAAILLVLLVGFGCSSAEGPAASLSVSNDQDEFLFIAQSLDRIITQHLQYPYLHTTTIATVSQQSTINEGQVTVVIKDKDGTVLYTSDMKTQGDFPTLTGTTNDWTIDITMVKVRGDVVFGVAK